MRECGAMIASYFSLSLLKGCTLFATTFATHMSVSLIAVVLDSLLGPCIYLVSLI